MGFEVNSEQIPTYKLAVHICQIVLSLTIWCLEIAVFNAGAANGLMGWTFGVCFLSVPAWIYLVGTPRWPRTRKLANAHAMVCVDALFVIIWLSAFSTQAAFNTKGLCSTACGPSKAIVGLGVFETLLWVASTGLSYSTLRYHDFNGVLPGYENMRGNTRTQNIDPDKAAFSTAPHDEEAYAPVGMGDADHDHEQEFNASPYGGAPHDPHDPNAYNVPAPYGEDTSYGGAGATHDNGAYEDHGAYNHPHGTSPAPSRLYAPPPAAADDYDENRPVTFPDADYSRTIQLGTH